MLICAGTATKSCAGTATGDTVSWTINDVWNCKTCEKTRLGEEQSKKEHTKKVKESESSLLARKMTKAKPLADSGIDSRDGDSGADKINVDT